MSIAPSTPATSNPELDGVALGRVGFAGLHLAGPGGWGRPLDISASEQLLRAAIDAGVTYIDTADTLGPGVSESVIGAVVGSRDDLIVATKAGMTRTGPREWGILGRPDYLKQQAYASAIRLRVDAIPLFYLHRIDSLVPLADQLGALLELRERGVIRHIGISGVSAEQLRAAQSIAPIAAVQNHYNAVSRDSEEVLSIAAASNIPFVAFWTLGHGRALLDDPVIVELAGRESLTPAQLLIAWTLGRSDHIIALPGTSRIDRLTANLSATGIRLRDDTRARLDKLAAGRAPVPAA